MPSLTCTRCGFTTDAFREMERHVSQREMCQPLRNNEAPTAILTELDPANNARKIKELEERVRRLEESVGVSKYDSVTRRHYDDESDDDKVPDPLFHMERCDDCGHTPDSDYDSDDDEALAESAVNQ